MIMDSSEGKRLYVALKSSFLQVCGLWCLMPLSTIFQLYHRGQFYWWKKPEYLEKTTDLSQIRQNLSNNVVSSTHRLSGVRTHNVSGDRH